MYFQQETFGRKFGTSELHLSPLVALAVGGGSVVVDSFLLLLPLFVGFCVWSLFCYM